jgi:hypothetical protein
MTATGLLTPAVNKITPASSTPSQIATCRMFVMVHLLTASIEQAESASLEAIEAWNPETESDEALLRHGIAAALRKTLVPHDTIESAAGSSYLPADLQAVLKLPPSHRRCFSLRMLGGLSPVDCARLLHLHLRKFEKYMRSAVAQLAKFNRPESKEEQMNNQDLEQGTVQLLAYRLWLERGCPDGSPEEDWFRAEGMLGGDQIAQTPSNAKVGTACYKIRRSGGPGLLFPNSVLPFATDNVIERVLWRSQRVEVRVLVASNDLQCLIAEIVDHLNTWS